MTLIPNPDLTAAMSRSVSSSKSRRRIASLAPGDTAGSRVVTRPKTIWVRTVVRHVEQIVGIFVHHRRNPRISPRRGVFDRTAESSTAAAVNCILGSRVSGLLAVTTDFFDCLFDVIVGETFATQKFADAFLDRAFVDVVVAIERPLACTLGSAEARSVLLNLRPRPRR